MELLDLARAGGACSLQVEQRN